MRLSLEFKLLVYFCFMWSSVCGQLSHIQGSVQVDDTLKLRTNVITTRWDHQWLHYEPVWNDDEYRIWMKQSWSMPSGDRLYLGSTGNRSNVFQGALLLSQKKGLVIGKGSDSGILSEEHFVFSPDSTFILRGLAGMDNRVIGVDSMGKVIEMPINVPKFYPISFLNATSENAQFKVNYYEGAYIGINIQDVISVPIVLPHGDTLKEIKFRFVDNSENDYQAKIIRIDNDNLSISDLSPFLDIDEVNSPDFLEYSIMPFSSVNSIDNQNWMFALIFQAAPGSTWDGMNSRIGAIYAKLE